jgi:hypothetical protein
VRRNRLSQQESENNFGKQFGNEISGHKKTVLQPLADPTFFYRQGEPKQQPRGKLTFP